jgi:peptidoglycan/xylan/chitin deacetylase (PgdA/CDA1 family)
MTLTGGLKRAAAVGLFRSGALALHRAAWERRRSILLMYHRVNDENDPFFPSLPVKRFTRQLDYLVKHYPIDTLKHVVDWTVAGANGRPRVALTFDDGYPDTYEYVLPELEKRDLPATVFLSTSPPETSTALWADRIRHAVKHATRETIDLTAIGLGRVSLRNLPERLETVRRLLARLKQESPPIIDDAVADLVQQAEPDGPPRRTLSWEQIHRMHRGGLVEIGAHTHRHYVLSRLDPASLRDEIETSTTLIERNIGTSVKSFSYPNGQPGDYDERSIGILRELGIRYAVTTQIDFIRPGLDSLELTRLYTSASSLPLFAARIAGLGTGGRRR